MSTPRSRTLRWFAPVVGGVAPAVFLMLRALPDSEFGGLISAFVAWVARDLVLAYLAALPVVYVMCRLGVRQAALLWAVVAALGAPIGYVLAHPVRYAWTPDAKDFEHGPYWSVMLGYMALFGLTGLAYGVLWAREQKEVNSAPEA